MHEISIEFISVFGLPPLEFVDLAAELGCGSIGTGLVPMPGYNPHGYPAWSLSRDRALRERMVVTMRDRAISVSLVEGFFVMPRADVVDYAADLDVVCEVGAKRINTLGLDPDMSRTLDQLATLVEMAGKRGLATTLEFVPGLPIGNLSAAVDAVRHVARPNFKLLIDAMHLVRSGSGAADIAALAPDSIGYVQLCDVPLESRFAQYADEAKYERMVPGTGELPLLDILAALP